MSPPRASLVHGSLEPPLRFEVRGSDGATWRFDVRRDPRNHPVLLMPAMIDDGRRELVPLGGERRGPNFAEAKLAIEAEMRRLWNNGQRLWLTAAGFSTPPPERLSTAGRPQSVTEWTLAVRVRRLLKDSRLANGEKTLTLARKAGILERPPRAREFTRLGRARLRQADRAASNLLALLTDAGSTVGVETFGPALVGPLKVEAVNAAIDDLEASRRVRITRRPSPSERLCHLFEATEIALV